MAGSRLFYNGSMNKKSELIKLRNQVIQKYFGDRWQEVWFFPQYEKVPTVKGYLGTSPIFFVSINPSFGAYPSPADLFYYRHLARQGFGNAHLTDVFKIKCKNENANALMQNKNLLSEMESILKKEIEILQPKLIVGIGTSYEKLYRRVFGKHNIPLYVIPHYAPQFNTAEKEKRFRRKLRGIRREYLNL
jgi:hypothetical protein